ncbi:MAG: MaoC family dehydratase [Pseudomonadales bacterium]|nr:MaoC family dehydratase [Pseudomonadales bacterium]
MSLTGNNNYFDDFEIGQVIQHARGKTMCENDNVGITMQVLNTADAHYNEDRVKDTFGKRLQFGGVTISMIIGMSMQDTGENALRELGLNKIRLKTSVFHGDTLYAYSEILEKKPVDDISGEVTFKHWGVNQKNELVFEGERRTLIKRKPA